MCQNFHFRISCLETTNLKSVMESEQDEDDHFCLLESNTRTKIMTHQQKKIKGRTGNAILWLVFLVSISGLATSIQAARGRKLASCDKSRLVFNSTKGIIQDGDSLANYTQNTHCEWLIEPSEASKFISLKFLEMDTVKTRIIFVSHIFTNFLVNFRNALTIIYSSTMESPCKTN